MSVATPTVQVVGEIVRYTYRLRPGARAERALMAEWHRCRWLWNEAVYQEKSGRKPTLCKLSKLLTQARARSAWLREGSQVAQQQTLRSYTRALGHAYQVKGRGKPVVKHRKRALPSLEYTRRGFGLRNRRLCLPRAVSIPVVWSRELPSAPSSVRVYQDNLGHWYASFVAFRQTRAAPEVSGAIGIDGGVSTVATTTDPAYDLPYEGYRKRCAVGLAKAQQRMTRRRRPRGQAQPAGYRRAKREAARIQ
jgi:putative transposase